MNLPISIASIVDNVFQTDLKKGSDGSSHFLSSSSLRREEVEELCNLILNYKPFKTLEIGLALSTSCAGIIAAKISYEKDEKHIALDPFQEAYSMNVGLLELERLGLKDHIDFRPEFSEVFLNECFNQNEKFDFIFIDGSHTIGQAVTDAFLAEKVLNDSGIIVIHDSLMFSTSASIKYLMHEKGFTPVFTSKYSLKTILRILKYAFRLGFSYSKHVIPKMRLSLVALQKPNESKRRSA